jgi:hypothetical protein
MPAAPATLAPDFQRRREASGAAERADCSEEVSMPEYGRGKTATLQRWLLWGAGTLSLLVLSCGCASVGPATVAQDRFDYNSAISESWKRQTLLNIVKLRYLDPPSFTDIGQIVAGYSLETGVNASGQLAKTNMGDQFVGIGGHTVFTDRPTITYTPLTGNRFVRGLMQPILPENLFFAIQSGWPANYMLSTAVMAINGLRNEELSFQGGYIPPDPKFLRVAELLYRIQRSGAVGMKIIQDQEQRTTKLLSFRTRMVTPETRQDIAELRELLDLDLASDEFQLVFGATASNRQEIAVQTRSLIHILNIMAGHVDVPVEDIEEGRATPGVEPTGDDRIGIGKNRIHCSATRPTDAFAAVEYQGHWFWVDNRDLVTKRSFSLMMLIFSLADTSDRESLPLLTIPTR